MQITNIKELLKSTKSILNWGPPITGKTYSLWTLVDYLKKHDLGPLHLFSLDRKYESLVLKLEKEGLLDHLVVYEYGRGKDKMGQGNKPARSQSLFLEMIGEFNRLSDLVDPKTGKWVDSSKRVGAVCMDQLTDFGEVTLDFILGKAGKDIGDPGTDARAYYRDQQDKIKEMIECMKSLPCISIWNAHAQYDKDDLMGKIMCLPLTTGKLAPILASKFNIVLFSECVPDGKGGYKYNWICRPDPSKFISSAGMTSRLEYPPVIEQDYRSIL